ncbi:MULTISPECIES: hypothetical protein [unclassified Streptomyces]|uniref:hypothetical protein n=1 Tax=unclassified Streptomyces TaxID=2593676 RepID=UPI00224D1E69|nr:MULTISPECIES: hypothetical protein [unclassified Streptomyces]WSP55288.1 hypothetical protein OG306_13480 [Streptomyces sp. NBC_01241]WSU23982.1 hypothetical protein OG508_25635 [Streptomyces sp. NBC_01108]MCX4797254.1 hypothetical protein [Streptomyces sp. NBC_01242]WSJ38545.1 hypothetical protein OG772_22745 [Streptomyces sp. NBC_01321]WSP64833.1 hypothetical protein OG466_25355 [Streptomyces sp. NBC_01240]
MSDVYEREKLTTAVAESKNWTDLMRRLGLKKSGGQRRVLQEKVAGHGLDTAHFKQRSPWLKYPDAAIEAAVASSSSLRPRRRCARSSPNSVHHRQAARFLT